jgi:uncharacterized membrane protein YgdD (TMEM256/DUF423 family)
LKWYAAKYSKMGGDCQELYLFVMDWIKVSGLLGLLGVGLGAFGAHLLKARLTPEMLAIWQTAVLYHLLHAVALLALALYGRQAGVDIRFGAAVFTAGIALFSGSLYGLALSGVRSLGAVTPLGGICFLLGWVWVAFFLGNRIR